MALVLLVSAAYARGFSVLISMYLLVLVIHCRTVPTLVFQQSGMMINAPLDKSKWNVATEINESLKR